MHPDTPASPRPRIALATVEQGWVDDDDAPLLVSALQDAGARAEPAMWDDPSIDWRSYDLVVVRSTWDYAGRAVEFLDWTRRVEAVTALANPAAVIAWNIDKHYLHELQGEGCTVVPTTYLDPGARRAAVHAAVERHPEYVVKPATSAGSRDTARYDAAAVGIAAAHAGSLLDAGRSVMVQPYLAAVDRVGETGMVFFGGVFSHAFRKGPLLVRGAAPTEGLFAREEIVPRDPPEDELELAAEVLAAAGRILGTGPLPYARVDVVRDDADRPVLLELELIEPSFFLETDPTAATRAAERFISLARRARRD